MRGLQSVSALREALQYLMTSDVPPQHKAVLIETVLQALSEGEAAQRAAQSTPTPSPWQENEIEELRALIAGRSARSWQEADEMVTRCARELHRAPDAVRAQAALLGLSAAVEYRPGRLKASEL
jgi:hypothetical protein